MNLNNIEIEYSAGISSQLKDTELPEVVFSGRSNVGKSSLLNKLCNRKSLARVSSQPGKTATINFFNVNNFYLVDLPGYGYAKVSHSEKKRWAELVEGYFAKERRICLIIQIIDIRHAPSKDDMQMLHFLKSINMPFVIVLTKKDKLNKTKLFQRQEELKKELEGFENIEKFAFSALSGEGKEAILEEIENRVNNYYIQLGDK